MWLCTRVSDGESESYHGVFSLDRFDLQIVVHSSARAVGFQFVLRHACHLFIARLVLAVFFGRVRSRGQVAALFLGDVGLGPVDGLHVFAQRAGVRVALGAAGDLTHVGFLRR